MSAEAGVDLVAPALLRVLADEDRKGERSGGRSVVVSMLLPQFSAAS